MAIDIVATIELTIQDRNGECKVDQNNGCTNASTAQMVNAVILAPRFPDRRPAVAIVSAITTDTGRSAKEIYRISIGIHRSAENDEETASGSMLA